MIIYKCDRCGRQTDEPVRIMLRPSEYSQALCSTTYDLCRECADDFEDFMSDPAAARTGYPGLLNAMKEDFERRGE